MEEAPQSDLNKMLIRCGQDVRKVYMESGWKLEKYEQKLAQLSWVVCLVADCSTGVVPCIAVSA